MNIYEGISDSLICDSLPMHASYERDVYLDLWRLVPSGSIINVIKCSELSCLSNCPVFSAGNKKVCPVCGCKRPNGLDGITICGCGTYIKTSCNGTTVIGIAITVEAYAALKSLDITGGVGDVI